MPQRAHAETIALPKDWKPEIKSAVLQVIALARCVSGFDGHVDSRRLLNVMAALLATAALAVLLVDCGRIGPLLGALHGYCRLSVAADQ